MKRRLTALLLAAAMLLSACSQSTAELDTSEEDAAEVVTETAGEESETSSESAEDTEAEEASSENAEDDLTDTAAEDLNFTELNDVELLTYIEDNLYAEMETALDTDVYTVEAVSAVYVSQEYLEESAYNSQSNIYFGYTLSELDEQFDGTRYIFTTDENGLTTVQAMEVIEDTDMQAVMTNVAIGTGVILVCVTVSVVTAGVGSGAVSVVFAAAAKTGTAAALGSGTLAAVSAAIVTGLQTGDLDSAFDSALLAGSEGFKWGAITGAIAGGISSAVNLYRANTAIRTAYESEQAALAQYGGTDQVSYLNGETVSWGTPGSTRPDLITTTSDGQQVAIEVKNYDLENNLSSLCSTLKEQLTTRAANLPEGMSQKVVLDVQGRGYSDEVIQNAITKITQALSSVNLTDVAVEIL